MTAGFLLRKLAAPATVAAAAVLLVSCSGGGRETSEDILKKAVIAAENGDWEEAGKLASGVIKKDPKDANALTLLALSLDHAGKQKQALDEARKAAHAAPSNFMAQYMLGSLLFASGKFDESIAPLKAAHDLRPENIDTTVLLAQASSILKLPDAVTYYAVIAKHPRYQSQAAPWNELGALFADKKDFNRAAEFFARAYKLEPDNHIVALNLAVFIDKCLGKPGQAKQYYYRYQKLAEKNPELSIIREKVKKRLLEISGGKSKGA
jgi:Tfp pilus assembly protein PilF